MLNFVRQSAAIGLTSVLVVSAPLGVFAASKCAGALQAKSTLTAGEMTQETLRDLIGAQISYSGKYAPADPTDRRTISGRGIVQSVALWKNDARPSFSIKFVNEKGVLFHTQIQLVDPTFKLKIEKPSTLGEFKESVESSGQKVKTIDLTRDDLALADELRDLGTRRLSLLIVERSTDSDQLFSTRVVKATSVQIPSVFDLLMSSGKPAEFIFETAEGPVKLTGKDIIAYAYSMN